MGKASTNAGRDPYLRPDFQFDIKVSDKPGIPFTTKPAPMQSAVKTEYKDKNSKDLYFKDEVEVDNEKFEIDYDSKTFKWIVKNEKKTVALKEVYKRTVLVRKCPARQKI
jgi:hypothetical protein